jgi:hypothetical protein
VSEMAHRCKACGRVCPVGQAFCNKDGCKKPKLPRCKYCNALYRVERNQAKFAVCPSTQAPGSMHDFGEDLDKVVR